MQLEGGADLAYFYFPPIATLQVRSKFGQRFHLLR
jgi:hypothetical protein